MATKKELLNNLFELLSKIGSKEEPSDFGRRYANIVAHLIAKKGDADKKEKFESCEINMPILLGIREAIKKCPHYTGSIAQDRVWHFQAFDLIFKTQSAISEL